MKILLLAYLIHLVTSGYLSCTYIVFKAHEGDMKLNYHKNYEKSNSDEDKDIPKHKPKKEIRDVPISVGSDSITNISDDIPKKQIRSLRRQLSTKKNKRSSFFKNEVINIATSSGPRILEGEDNEEKDSKKAEKNNVVFVSDKSEAEVIDPTLLYLIEISCRIQDGFTEYTVEQNLTCPSNKKIFSIEFKKDNRVEVQSLIFANAFEGRKSYITDEFNQEYVMTKSLPLLIADNPECKLVIKASWITSVVSAIALLMLL